MGELARSQPSQLKIVSQSPLDCELREFLIDRQARNLTPKTLSWYRQSLDIWRAFLRSEDIQATADVTASTVRRFLLDLAAHGHNAGGVVNIFGAVKAFLRWYADESAPAGWQDPLSKVKNPRRPQEPLEPLDLGHLRAMLDTCEPRTFAGARDRALLTFLLDSGVRHRELTDLDVGDVNLSTGAVLVRCGKGRKPRTVFVGAKTRKALVAYLKRRGELAGGAPLWATAEGGRLSYDGIRGVIRRRAVAAGVPEPSLHSFRRAFALLSLRAGMDVYSLQRLMGHADLGVLRRYLAQTADDLQAAHDRASPVDRL